MDKENAVYMHVCVCIEYFSAIKRNAILPFAKYKWTLRALWQWNKSDRQRHILYDLTYMWNLEKMKNKIIETGTDWWLPEVVGFGAGGARAVYKRGEENQKVQTSSYKINTIGTIIINMVCLKVTENKS